MAKKNAAAAVPGIGAAVLYVLPAGAPGVSKESVGQVRPGIIVSVGKDSVNLQVFTNGDGNKVGDHLGPMMWVQAPAYDPAGKAEGTWRYAAAAGEAEAAES